jgi:hypothetical protein
MSYFALGASLDATVVHIMDNFGAHGCYLLSAQVILRSETQW